MPTLAVGMWRFPAVLRHAHGKRGHGTLSRTFFATQTKDQGVFTNMVPTMTEKAYLAVDMGASSGRHVLGLFDGQRLRLEEVYRFENGPVEVAGRLYWDLLGQWSHVRQGLRAAGGKCGRPDRQRRRRYLGRRFRPAGPRRRTAGQPLPLPRQPHQRHDGKGLRHRQPRRDLPPHRPAVHAVQHAVSTAGDEAGRLAAVGRGRDRC